MKIVLWIGKEGNQKALANKIHARFPLTGIVCETRKNTRTITLGFLFEKLAERFFLSAIGKSWNKMKSYYNVHYPNYPGTNILHVEDINSEVAYNFTKELNPDLVLVSGTRLVKEKMLSLKPHNGIMNLHTGLSPYIKGGPNCTNWCIATGQFHLIGNTIMWIDAGIDSGNIVRTDFTVFDGNENLYDIHLKVMEHAHDLYLKAIEDIIKNNYLNVPQASINAGKTFYNKDWGLKEKINLIKNMPAFRKKNKNGETNRLKQSIVVVKPSNAFLG